MLAIYRTESCKRCIAAKYKGLRYGDRRGSFSEWESENWTSKRERERGHTYLAILVFCARDHGELLIVQHWSSGSKKKAPLLLPLMRHCCLGKFISSVESQGGHAWCRSATGVCPSNSGEELNIALSIWAFYSSGLPAVRNVGECLYCSLLSGI